MEITSERRLFRISSAWFFIAKFNGKQRKGQEWKCENV